MFYHLILVIWIELWSPIIRGKYIDEKKKEICVRKSYIDRLEDTNIKKPKKSAKK